MSKTTFSRSELRLPENPYHSALSQPWAMVALGGLIVRLRLVECPHCREALLIRSYFADKLALLWQFDESPESVERRDSFSKALSHEVAMMTMEAPALIYAGPHELKFLRTGLPGFVREFFTRAKSILAYPLATHKATTDRQGAKFLGDFCPHCNSDISGTSGHVLTSLIVTLFDDDPCLQPVPIICQI